MIRKPTAYTDYAKALGLASEAPTDASSALMDYAKALVIEDDDLREEFIGTEFLVDGLDDDMKDMMSILMKSIEEKREEVLYGTFTADKGKEAVCREDEVLTSAKLKAMVGELEEELAVAKAEYATAISTPPEKKPMKWIEQWKVDSSNGKQKYTVSRTAADEFGCSCKAWTSRRIECKHIRYIKELRELGSLPRAEVPDYMKGIPVPAPERAPEEILEAISKEREERRVRAKEMKVMEERDERARKSKFPELMAEFDTFMKTVGEIEELKPVEKPLSPLEKLKVNAKWSIQ